jgi:predicted TIM-barrel fold metal-dependent hydrolase
LGTATVVGRCPYPGGSRLETYPKEGPPGSDPDLLREQLLDGMGVDRAVLHPIANVVKNTQSGELALAVARAVNDWVADEWLTADKRLYGAISVPIEDGVYAAEEIHRAAENPRFVKVLLTGQTREPLGDRKYWPIYEAAVAHDLAIGIHIGGFSGSQTGAGWSSYFVEFHANFTMSLAGQMISLTCSGVFDRFPSLQVLLEEGGLGWIPNVLWRLDRTWQDMPEGIPGLIRPSHIVREHFWIATQPLDEPEKTEYLVELLDQVDMDDHIVFSTDYPHHDHDDPSRVLPASLIGAERRTKILSTNADNLFRFIQE